MLEGLKQIVLAEVEKFLAEELATILKNRLEPLIDQYAQELEAAVNKNLPPQVAQPVDAEIESIKARLAELEKRMGG